MSCVTTGSGILRRLAIALTQILLLAILCPKCARPQLAGADQRQFEVASIKLHDPKEPLKPLQVTPLGIEYQGATLYDCIKEAYVVADYQIKAGDNDLVVKNRFDIRAKTEAPVPRRELLLMFRALLADRFDLRIHMESRELATYHLVLAKKGSALKPAAQNATAFQGRGIREISFKATTMSELADFLGGLESVGKPVLDETNLPDRFDFVLRMAGGSEEVPATYDEHLLYDWPSIFGDVQRLGLRLTRARDKVTVLVVDHASMPSGN